jgi:acetyl esterase/lipase
MWHRTNALLSWNYYLGSDYVRGGDNVPYLAAPARADDLAGLPPAYISTMEFDPLRDEGLIYGLRLLQAGVPAEIHNFPGTFHGSSLVQEAKVSKRERRERVAVLRRALDL